MIKDDILRMAREAGLAALLRDTQKTHEALERFAALVAAAEREACAQVCEEYAKHKLMDEMPIAYVYSSRDCAEAIRARSST